MTGVRARGEEIRRYILENVEEYPGNIAAITAEKFGISRQAVNHHLKRLTNESALQMSGSTRARIYKLCPLVVTKHLYELSPELTEDAVWRQDIRPFLEPLPDNVRDIWHHGFTEMFNNAIDHSVGKRIFVQIEKTAVNAEMKLFDDGVGIFKKIQDALGLLDERHAILELAKGKFTTDPKNHSGEGIFFTSRMFDSFVILSGGVYFSHDHGEEKDWVVEPDTRHEGTYILMRLNNHTSRTVRKVFDEFSSADPEEGLSAFDKTIVPVKLARYGDDNLVSRSQAKRLLARIELFRTVILNFSDVPTIGQAFADEIFRVFAREHRNVELIPIHANAEVMGMIRRATSRMDG